ncbi:MAG: DUF523 domain-containing protein [Clostridia bacterium]|nr:DUF523 domain-containing protein [Clostridia bacterium]
MEKILISACLIGIASRYDGKSKLPEDGDVIWQVCQKYAPVPFCPEVYGGLPTPRTPSERVGDRVLMKDGRDVTENYERGAEGALMLCKRLGIKKALLKERSPSCGKGKIYDGSFRGVLTEGDGVCAELLISSGIEVFGESEAPRLLEE